MRRLRLPLKRFASQARRCKTPNWGHGGTATRSSPPTGSRSPARHPPADRLGELARARTPLAWAEFLTGPVTRQRPGAASNLERLLGNLLQVVSSQPHSGGKFNMPGLAHEVVRVRVT